MLRGFLLAVLCFTAGAISHFAMAPYNLVVALFIGIPALFYALQRTDRKRIKFLFTWLFGFGYFVFGLSWISNALLVPGNEDFYWAYPLAIGGLPALLALFPAFFVTFITYKSDLEHLSGWWAFVFALSLSEIARGYLFTGFPWNNFAYGWINALPISQIVSVGGLYFLTILTVFWAATPGLIFLHKRGTPVIITFMITALTFGATYFYGHNRINSEPVFIMEDVRLHLVQPNIKQEDKWAAGMLDQHFENLMELSQNGIKETPNLMNVIIWPETASVRSVLFRESNIKDLTKIIPEKSNNYLITGLLHGIKKEDQRVFYNSLTVFGPGQTIIDNYDKSHLVPFGEYIPFNQIIPIDPVVNFSGFQAGPGPKRIQLTKSFAISPLICYEIIFPGRSIPPRQKRTPHPNLIVNVTNDAWYGDSDGPRQHLVQTQFRAIETGIPVARVANTGISSLISPIGRHASLIDYGKRGIVSHPLILPLQNETLFAKFQQKIMVGLLILLGMGIYIFRKDH